MMRQHFLMLPKLSKSFKIPRVNFSWFLFSGIWDSLPRNTRQHIEVSILFTDIILELKIISTTTDLALISQIFTAWICIAKLKERSRCHFLELSLIILFSFFNCSTQVKQTLFMKIFLIIWMKKGTIYFCFNTIWL